MAQKPCHVTGASTPDCTQAFSQKAAACNHICHNHLNIALACIYCSAKENPKMWWYSASAWEVMSINILKMTSQYFLMILPLPTYIWKHVLSTSSSTSESLLANIILERAKAANQYLEEEAAKSTRPKCHIKQGPVKSSKKQKDE